MNALLKKLALTAFFLGLFLYLPSMDTILLDLTDADPVIVAFFQIGALAGAAATLLGGES